MKLAAVYAGAGREYHTSGEVVADEAEASERSEYHIHNGAVRTYLLGETPSIWAIDLVTGRIHPTSHVDGLPNNFTAGPFFAYEDAAQWLKDNT